jgi:hypothetical protein
MIRKKIKTWAIFKTALVVLSFSTIVFFSISGPASALSLENRTVATADAPGINCSVDFNPLTWVICPIIDGMSGLITGVDDFITGLLDINPCTYFNPSSAPNHFSNCPSPNSSTDVTSNGFYTAWGNLRNIALGFMVIGSLIMIISQIMGFEFLDAYTIKKVLPRLLVAAIGISLSWELVQFFIQLSNDLGNGVSYLIYEPFKTITSNGVKIGQNTSSAGAVISFGAIAASGIIAELTFVLVAVVAVLLGFVVIILRSILIIFLAILAPVAIAMFILPNTSKVWKMWWTTFSKALIMFPLIAGMIAVGRVFAAISSASGSLVGQFVAFIAYFGPYFIIPQTFKFAGGVLAMAGSAASNMSKSFNKSMAGFRSARRKQIHERRMEGSSRLGSGRTGNLYRRMATNPFASKANFKADNQKILANAAKKHLEEEGGRASGDDVATGLALQSGMTSRKFISEYQRINGTTGTVEGEAQARDALASIQKNFGARIGSDSMRVAAFKAKTAANTGYDPGADGLTNMYADAGAMVRAGLMTTTDAAAAIKANKNRADQSSVGFKDVISNVQRSATSAGGGLAPDEIAKLQDLAFENADPAEVVRGHTNTVKAMAPIMLRQLQAAVDRGDAKAQKRIAAKIANIYDTLAQISPNKAGIIADGVITKGLAGITTPDGKPITAQDLISGWRNDTEFTAYRREMNAYDPNNPNRPGIPPEPDAT